MAFIITLYSMDNDPNKSGNMLTKATEGASHAAVLVMNIIAMVIACIATIAFLNAMVSFFFGLSGLDHINFEYILGILFMPLAFMLGIDWAECGVAGRMIGIKTVVNEFIAYKQLGTMIANEQVIN